MTPPAAPTPDLGAFELRLLAELRQVVVEQRDAGTRVVTLPGRSDPTPTRSSAGWLRRAGLGVAAAAAVVAGVSVAVAGAPTPGEIVVAAGQSLVVGPTRIELGEGGDPPEAAPIAAALRELGVDVVEEPVPASPSLVGRVTSMVLPDGDGLAHTQGETDQDLLVDPSRYTATVTLLVGAPAAPGERYDSSGVAFAEGEVLAGLHCAVGWPMDPADVERAAARVGQRVVWEVWTPAGVDWDVSTPTARPDGDVSFVLPETSDTVVAAVVPRGGRPAAGAEDPRTWGPCSPEAAARWE